MIICTINYEPGKAGCLYLQDIKNIKTVQNATKAKKKVAVTWSNFSFPKQGSVLEVSKLKCLSDFKCTRLFVVIVAEGNYES